MLQFIFGRPATGKTFTVMNKIKELSCQKKTAVLIVPEQFTFESERQILHTVGDRAALNISIFSFTRLCDEVGRIVGGTAGITLGDADKVIFMSRALKEVADQLCLWKKYAGSATFAKTMLDAIGEFKINAITPENLKAAAESTDSATLRYKLCDLALIFETYDLLVGEKFIDPADRLTKLYRNLCDFNFFKGKTVFIDSFKGFTGQQYKILERIIKDADDVYISLTNDVGNNSEFSVFSNIRTAAERLKRIANSYNITIAEPIILDKTYYRSPELEMLGDLISGKAVRCENAENITVVKATTVQDEAEYCARTIRRLVREFGYRYRDFVIISRDAERYTEAVSAACQKNDVAVFYDKRVPLSAFPLSIAADSAIKALRFSTENILRFHKSGLGTLTADEISVLQNYTYLWNIDGELWLKEWDMDTRGFVAEDDKNSSAPQELEHINTLRERAIAPIIRFKSGFKNNAREMATAIIGLFSDCDTCEKLTLMSEQFKAIDNAFTSEVLRQSYDEYIRILDSLVRCFGEKSLTINEFSDALELSVSLASVGVIPQMLDEVTFGAADRIRPSRPKIAFILGANQGIFPKPTQNSGVFNLPERKRLIEFGLEIADNSVYSSVDEDYLVYCNLCCPSDANYISYATQSVTGELLEPSAFVKSISATFDCNIVITPQEVLTADTCPETHNAAFSEYCRRIGNSCDFATLNKALNLSGYSAKTELAANVLNDSKMTISKTAATKLYGKDIYMSASKFDTLNRCKFSYFAKYGLRVKKLQPAEFDVMQRGTIVHFVLQQLITDYKDSIGNLTTDELDSLTEQYINTYLDRVAGYRSIENARLKFLVSRLTRSLKEVVRHIAAELSQSEFKPYACELSIGKNSEIPLIFPYGDGNIYINGSIDRVDEYNGFVRIIDYKTGSKSFKLPDIVFGLNLQMLIYLYAVIRGRGLEDSAAAGILYQPSSRDLNSKGMAMNGLLKLDSDLVKAMDSTGDGVYVPKLKYTKSGSLDKRCTSFIEDENFTEIFDYIEKLMARAGNSVISGDIAVSPLDGRESAACKYCDFSAICGIEDKPINKVPELSNDEVFNILREADNRGL